MDVRKSVFLAASPSIEALKGCGLFWDQIYVFEGFIQEATREPALFGAARPLIDEGILRVVLQPYEDKLDVYDKVYAGIGQEEWEYLQRNSSKLAFKPSLPADSDTIIDESTKLDLQNKELIMSIQKAANETIERRWNEGAEEALRERGIDKLPEPLDREIRNEVNKLIGFEKQWLQNYGHPWDESSLHYRNEVLLIQSSVSPSINIDADDLPYYSLKLNGFKTEDAKRYLSGWEALLPLTQWNKLDGLSMKEVLAIRKRSDWRKAMDDLASICEVVAASPYDPRFQQEVKDAVLAQYQDVLEGYRVTKGKVGRELAKTGILSAISVIPVLGPVISGAGGFADPVQKYIRDRGKQQNLPFFINGLKTERMHSEG